MKRLSFGACLCVVLVFVVAPAAHATWTGNFTSDHVGGTGGAGTAPFGQVQLVQNGADVDVTVSLFNGNKFVATGAGGGYNFLFDVNAANFPASNISGAGLTVGSGNIHADSTGDWAFGVVFTNQLNGGGSASAGPITFTVSGATIAELTAGNGTAIFAADILSGTTGNTGMVDVQAPVPIPGAMLLLGPGLAGLVALRRRSKG